MKEILKEKLMCISAELMADNEEFGGDRIAVSLLNGGRVRVLPSL